MYFIFKYMTCPFEYLTSVYCVFNVQHNDCYLYVYYVQYSLFLVKGICSIVVSLICFHYQPIMLCYCKQPKPQRF
jgi:hypothetical protein